MFIESVCNRNSPPCIFLCETYRDAGKVRHRTLANLSKWPTDFIDGLRSLFNGRSSESLPASGKSFKIVRSLPHGHVAAVLSTMGRLGFPHILGSKPCPERDLCMAMIAARILFPGSKLATSRALGSQSPISSLARECGIDEGLHENDLYAAMDWLLPRQSRIEKVLAHRHLDEGSLVLYDLSSSYFEGTQCPLAKLGHNRDGKKGKLQIEYGLLCNATGTPVAIEVFEGNAADPTTLGSQIQKLRNRFGLRRLVLVGDRGMITQARIDQELRGIDGLDWISALRSSQISALAREGLIHPFTTKKTSPKSPAPTFRENVWSFAAIPCWPTPASANARISFKPQKKTSAKSKPPLRAARNPCADGPRSDCRPDASSTNTRRPSTSP